MIGLRVQNEAGQRLTEFWHENAPVITNTIFQQHKRRLYIWTSPEGQYQNQLIIFFCSRRRSSIQSEKSRPGADCDSYHELLIVKFRLKLKKVWKTTQLSRYGLNQIPYSGMTNIFKGLDLIDQVPEELWTEFSFIVQEEAVIKASPRKRNAKRQNGCLRRSYK